MNNTISKIVESQPRLRIQHDVRPRFQHGQPTEDLFSDRRIFARHQNVKDDSSLQTKSQFIPKISINALKLKSRCSIRSNFAMNTVIYKTGQQRESQLSNINLESSLGSPSMGELKDSQTQTQLPLDTQQSQRRIYQKHFRPNFIKTGALQPKFKARSSQLYNSSRQMDSLMATSPETISTVVYPIFASSQYIKEGSRANTINKLLKVNFLNRSTFKLNDINSPSNKNILYDKIDTRYSQLAQKNSTKSKLQEHLKDHGIESENTTPLNVLKSQSQYDRTAINDPKMDFRLKPLSFFKINQSREEFQDKMRHKPSLLRKTKLSKMIQCVENSFVSVKGWDTGIREETNF